MYKLLDWRLSYTQESKKFLGSQRSLSGFMPDRFSDFDNIHAIRSTLMYQINDAACSTQNIPIRLQLPGVGQLRCV